jgi:hypothetical protein
LAKLFGFYGLVGNDVTSFQQTKGNLRSVRALFPTAVSEMFFARAIKWFYLRGEVLQLFRAYSKSSFTAF